MALRSAPLWLLALLAVALRESCVAASFHALKYFYTTISEPTRGQPHFVALGYVDDQLFGYYDSNSQRVKPRVSWVEKVENEDPHFWDTKSQKYRGEENVFRGDLEILRNFYNQSEEPPVVTMSSRTEDGMETHVCRMDGFYPREIDASWTRDGEVWQQDILHASVVPNADGTYNFWLRVRIDPKERDRYRCHVQHDGLQEPLDVALKEPTDSKSNWGLIISCVVAGLVLVCLIAWIFFRRRQNNYNAAPTSERGSSSSDQGSNQLI